MASSTMAGLTRSFILAAMVLGCGSVHGATLTKVLGFDASSGAINCGGGYLCKAPPDTMGAVGLTQYFEINNGSAAVFSKAGTFLQRYSLPSFWSKAGLAGGSSGDQRVLFDLYTNRWIVVGFGPTATTGDLNIAVSDGADAMGTWKGTSFKAFNTGANPVADYPTLAMDDKAIYIGANNFNTVGTSEVFRGSSMFVIPKADLFGGSPTAANRSTFFNATNPTTLQAPVNWQGNTANSTAIVGNDYSIYDLNFVKANISNPLSVSFASPTRLGLPAYTVAGAARQPNGSRVIGTIGDRISANTYQVNGKVYGVHTVKTGSDYAKLQWFVVDANSGSLIGSGLLGQDGYDYFQGSIAVNASGRAVIAYNRSGSAASDGQVSVFAQAFSITPSGALVAETNPLLLKQSPINNYCDTRCFQRWGDYASITLDPVETDAFWAIGEYATGSDQFTGWNTYVSKLLFAGDVVAVPAPAPLLGVPMLLGWSRVMRRRIRHSSGSAQPLR